jgi:hypothetical protein
MFASRTIAKHLARGAVGIAALVVALTAGPAHPLLYVVLLPAALVALRGCPTCWTIGLVQTIAARIAGRHAAGACGDGRCARDSDGRES